jgi:hypothetical protein
MLLLLPVWYRLASTFSRLYSVHRAEHRSRGAVRGHPIWSAIGMVSYFGSPIVICSQLWRLGSLPVPGRFFTVYCAELYDTDRISCDGLVHSGRRTTELTIGSATTVLPARDDPGGRRKAMG